MDLYQHGSKCLLMKSDKKKLIGESSYQGNSYNELNRVLNCAMNEFFFSSFFFVSFYFYIGLTLFGLDVQIHHTFLQHMQEVKALSIALDLILGTVTSPLIQES